MRLKSLFNLAALATCVAVAAPAWAQHRGGGGGGHFGGGVSRGMSRGSAVRGGAAVRGIGVPHAAITSRGYGGVRAVGAVPRGAFGYRTVAPVRFVSPYYAFHPRLSLGFGLWVGYPIVYPYAFYDPYYSYYPPYPYPAPYGPYGYAYPPAGAPAPPADTYPSQSPSAQGSVGVQPGQTSMGGLSFDITPNTAQVFIDGNAVGTVGQFTPTSQPLGLPAGSHHVEIRAPGYHTLTFDVQIVAGQVIPYQGAMER